MELGYVGVAYDRHFRGVISDSPRCSIDPFPLDSLLEVAPSLFSSAAFRRDLLGALRSSTIRQDARLIVSVAEAASVVSLNVNALHRTYDLVAVPPLNQEAFDKACESSMVGQFIDCLVDARTELQRKSEINQRSFKIKKALLCKADRSSFDRLCQQICKLETEHKRLEEDAIVYNLLQEQLKLSPAYKMLLEASENMEDKVDSDHATELPDISFEELLAQEKKDMF